MGGDNVTRSVEQFRTNRGSRVHSTFKVTIVALMFLAASCSSTNEPETVSAQTADPDDVAPSTTAVPTTTVSTTTTTTTEPERRPFKGTVSGQPSYLVPGSYRSASLRADLTFEILETENRVRWNGFRDLEHQMLMLLTTPERVPGDDPSAVPGFSIVAPLQTLDVESAVEAILAATPSNGIPFFTAEPGQLVGIDATVVRGDLSQDIEFQSRGEWTVALPDGTKFVLLEQKERQYLMYVFELAGQTLIVEMNAHPEQFDLVLTEGLRVAETLRAAP